MSGGVLQAIAADAPDDAWAVGGPSIFEEGPRPKALIEHWDGTRWALVAGQAVAGTLQSVAIAAPNSVWAVGEVGTSERGKFRGAGGHGQALAEHWNGAKWTRVRFPGVRRLSAAAATSARDVWMVGADSTGAALILHWDGERWTRVRRPDAELLGLAALSPTDVWAVGDISDRRFLEMHWNGRKWSSHSQLPPNGEYGLDDSPELTSVAASGSRDVWAAGDAGNAGEPTWPDTVLFHWDGTRWRKAVTPDDRWIYALALGARGDLWMAGGAGNGDAYSPPFLERRVEPKWQPINPAGQIDGLSTDQQDGLWAVGFVGSRFGSSLQFPHHTRTLITRARCL
ncbi:MAG TPA: hypothetical protein VKP14_04625 [Gaiellaceae bacterium]|nr:hypothetical protein [Gaiellaceae bacterium]